MKKSIKALLLSALIYPGTGHFYLRKPVQGTLFATVATVCLYFLLVTVVKIAQEISDKILSGEMPADIVGMTAVIQKMLDDSGLHQVNMTTSILFICWLVSIFDSYRLGRVVDAKKVTV